MRYLTRYRSFAITVFIVLCMFFFSTCINNENDKKNPAGQTAVNYSEFAGSASCAGCHRDIYESHTKTAHFRTSAPAIKENIRGNFDPAGNIYKYASGAFVSLQQIGDSFYQVAFNSNGIEKIRQHFDIVTGSGTKGQTYISCIGNNFYQLPVSYFTTAAAWCNSPGMPNKIVYYRPITSRCLECHSTFVEKISPEEAEPELFNRNHMILGVDCEKCHGPAARHVEYQTNNPTERTAKYIINPARFTRQQSLDLCSLCHGGRMQKTQPSFSFIAGDKLTDYFTINNRAADPSDMDVHGNQYGLLAASKCFLNSKTLTCMTCHDPHNNEQGKTETFSKRCISCHNEKNPDTHLCKMTATLGNDINNICTTCHMPELPSRAITVLLQGNDTLTPAKMHTHLIKNYPEQTEKVLALLRSANKKNKTSKKT